MKLALVVSAIGLFFSNTIYAAEQNTDLCNREWQSAMLKSQVCERGFNSELYSFMRVTSEKTEPLSFHTFPEQKSDTTIVAQHKSTNAYYLLQSPLETEWLGLLNRNMAETGVTDDRLSPLDKEELCALSWTSFNLQTQICGRHYSPDQYDFYSVLPDGKPIRLLHSGELRSAKEDTLVIAHHKESDKDYLIQGIETGVLENCAFLQSWLKEETHLKLWDDRLLPLSKLGVTRTSAVSKARYFLKTGDTFVYSEGNQFLGDSYMLYGQSPFCFVYYPYNGDNHPYITGDCDMNEVRKWIPEVKTKETSEIYGTAIMGGGMLQPYSISILTPYLIDGSRSFSCWPVCAQGEQSASCIPDVIHSGVVKQIFYDAKPIIYLYPEQETDVRVTLGYPKRLTHTYPKYTKGWMVTARPNGDLTDRQTGRHLYALYWEGKHDQPEDFHEGFVVAGADTIPFLEKSLAQLGLTEREAEEFIVYWLPQLENNPYNLIRFLTIAEQDRNMPLTIEPKPDTIIRVMMVWQRLEHPITIPPQVLSAPERRGFTVVEWGGLQIHSNRVKND